MNPVTSSSSPVFAPWVAKGSTAIPPPPEYWAHLAREMPGPQLEKLKEQSDLRFTEFTPRDLPLPMTTALELLNKFVSDGWVKPEQRYKCPRCAKDLQGEAVAATVCPYCGESFDAYSGVVLETVFVRYLAPNRSVDWVIAIHGMNTSGAWQEEFSWSLSTTWGRSVPVAVYKYGIVVAGVVMAWRRRKLQQNLRTKLAALRDQARAQGFQGNPDMIAHSFGTWLIGHLLKDELKRDSTDRLGFGRIILAGCVLRPDFDWKSIKEGHLVQDVLNHFGTADCIVPLAHATITDSGPSGRRGFDGDQVLNVQAVDFGHSDLFSTDKFAAKGMTCLANSYQKYWRPFLTLPAEELESLPDRMDPRHPWREFPWPLRGTIFPFLALPFILAMMGLLVAGIGRLVWHWWRIYLDVARVTASGLAMLLVMTAIAGLWRWWRS